MSYFSNELVVVQELNIENCEKKKNKMRPTALLVQ